MNTKCVLAMVVLAAVALWPVERASANGGPFVVKYPQGDPAAKGVLARLDPSLKPRAETTLRVVKEELKIDFQPPQMMLGAEKEVLPLANVSAEYTIENPTGEEVQVDFGFPILRGIYMSPWSMMPQPDVRVTLDKLPLGATVISNSAIYGMIRLRSREIIDKSVLGDPVLGELVEKVRRGKTEERVAVRRELVSYLTGKQRWAERDATLMAEYAGLSFDLYKSHPLDAGSFYFMRSAELLKLTRGNLGALGAGIGEQKTTQFFAQLAKCFDPKGDAGYESLFKAWGGDVRERSLDLETRRVRPREITLEGSDQASILSAAAAGDATVYARVDYFNDKAKISEDEQRTCKAILKNLPVIFTFAPMNLIHYQATFPANSTKKLTVDYRQYAFKDTKGPESYQLAYVVHPASLWRDFGPINLTVTAPQGVECRGSVDFQAAGTRTQKVRIPTRPSSQAQDMPFTVYQTTLTEKTGELLVAVKASDWRRTMRHDVAQPAANASAAQGKPLMQQQQRPR